MDPQGTARLSEHPSRYDFLIVGAGSAGCVLANRLSADGSRVLLLEAGGENRHPYFHVPVGFVKVLGRRESDWGHLSLDEPGLGGRTLMHFKGKVLGGSSSINGMIYVRGHRADFDRWAAEGCTGWEWDSVLPYFRRSEDYFGEADEIHSHGGELSIQPSRYDAPIMDRFIEASVQAGLPATKDCNQPDPLGLATAQSTLCNGVRCSTATAFLKPVRHRANLRVLTGALVERILFEGHRAVGVQYRVGTATQQVFAGEIILSAGAFKSPQLLELSGIGQAERLRALGLAVVQDLPGVGENLQDHAAVSVAFRLRGIGSANIDAQGWRLWREVLKFYLFRRGVLTMTPGMVSGFARIRREAPSADLQLMARPFSNDPKSRTFTPEELPGMSIAVCPCRPRNRGWSHIDNTEASANAPFRINFLTDPEDQFLMVEGIKLARQIVTQPAIAPFISNETTPGAAAADDSALLEFVRRAAFSAFHVAGSCKMGTDAQAVVDPRLRVRGITGLRIADASIMPNLPSANTNAATIMIAEKAADMIREDRRR
jgi:choline dehydrogenase